LAGNTFNDITFSSGAIVLNLEQGGLLRSNNNFASTIGTPTVRGVLTAGGTEVSGTRELIIYNTATANPTSAATFTTATGSPVVTGASTLGFQPGMTITNGNFAAGTRVLSVDNEFQMTLTNNATANGAGNQTLTAGSLDGGATTINLPTVTVASTTGITPGMTITNANFPTGTFVVSVDSATGLTLSQNATATAATQTFVTGMSNTVVQSVIANNGLGNSVQLIKSGAGILNLSAANTFTGGTIVNQGTLNLVSPGTAGVATNVVIPGNLTIDGGINGAAATVNVLSNVGQIAATSNVTLNAFGTARQEVLIGSLGTNNLQGGGGNDTYVIDNNDTVGLSGTAQEVIFINR
jgi:autotransporter-associated beta strand protein